MQCLQRNEVRFLLAAAALVLGEVAGFASGVFASAWPWLGVGLGTTVLAAWGWRLRHWLLPGIFMLGVLLAWRVEAELWQVLDNDAGVTRPRELLELEVESTPSEPCMTKDGRRMTDFLSHLGPLPVKAILPLPQDGPLPRVGEIWSIDGRISQPRSESRLFDRRSCYARRGATAVSMADRPRNLRRALWCRISDGLAEDVGFGLEWAPELADLNRAILLGRRADLPFERKRMFADAGTIHVFAISGLHVMVVAWLLMEVLGFLGLGSSGRALVALPLIVAYVLLTGARPSAIRAALMTGFYFLAPVFGRRPNGCMAWGLTAMVVYAYDPRSVYDLGCALSFTVMFGIVLWIRWIRPFAELHPRRNLRGWISRFLYGLGISFAAWLAGVPVTAYAFGRFTPGGLLANVVVISVAGIMVRLGMSALLMMLLCFPLAALINNVAAGCTWVMTAVSEWVAGLPFSSYEIAPWSIDTCAVWYVCWLLGFWLLGQCLPHIQHLHRRWW